MGGNNVGFEEQLLSSKGQLGSILTLLFELLLYRYLGFHSSAAADVYISVANER